jgi:hypothetical protein
MGFGLFQDSHSLIARIVWKLFRRPSDHNREADVEVIAPMSDSTLGKEIEALRQSLGRDRIIRGRGQH